MYRESLPIQIGEGIDRVLAAHYGFTDEELDFIPSTDLRAGINCDIKYRMGRDAESDDDGSADPKDVSRLDSK